MVPLGTMSTQIPHSGVRALSAPNEEQAVASLGCGVRRRFSASGHFLYFYNFGRTPRATPLLGAAAGAVGADPAVGTGGPAARSHTGHDGGSGATLRGGRRRRVQFLIKPRQPGGDDGSRSSCRQSKDGPAAVMKGRAFVKEAAPSSPNGD